MEPEEPWHAARALLAVLRGHIKIHERYIHCRHQRVCGALIFTPPDDSTADTQHQCRVALDLLHTLWLLNNGAWWHAMAELVNAKISERFASPAPTGRAAPLTVVVGVDSQQLAGDMISPPWETLLDAHVRLTDAEVAAKRRLIQAYAVGTLLSPLSAIPLRLTFKFVNRKATFPATVPKIITVVKAIRDQLSGTFTHKPLETCAALLLDALQLEVPAHEMTVGTIAPRARCSRSLPEGLSFPASHAARHQPPGRLSLQWPSTGCAAQRNGANSDWGTNRRR